MFLVYLCVCAYVLVCLCTCLGAEGKKKKRAARWRPSALHCPGGLFGVCRRACPAYTRGCVYKKRYCPHFMSDVSYIFVCVRMCLYAFVYVWGRGRRLEELLVGDRPHYTAQAGYPVFAVGHVLYVDQVCQFSPASFHTYDFFSFFLYMCLCACVGVAGTEKDGWKSCSLEVSRMILSSGVIRCLQLVCLVYIWCGLRHICELM